MIWVVKLSNGTFIDEDKVAIWDNPKKLSPWLLLMDYLEVQSLSIDNIALWDKSALISIYSPGKLAGKLPDSVDFRIRYISDGMSSNASPIELYGVVTTKNSVSFGFWYNTKTREIFTTIE